MARATTVRWKWKTPRRSREWKQLLHMDGLVSVMKDRGEAIKDRAVATAPVDTGEYRDSFHVVVGEGRDKKRAAVRVGNTAEHAGFVEFGADRTPAYHTLANAVAGEATGVVGGDA